MIKLNRETLKDKIYACWIGKNIGGTIGTPYEGKDHMNDIDGFSTPPGTVLPNDDLDLQLVWLRAIQDVGPYTMNEKILGEYWVSFISPHWNEYGIGKANMHLGLLPPMSGDYQNPWQHSNGAWIRTEVWACMAPGAPDVAMKYARMDASVDHGSGEGTYAAMFVAFIESAAFVMNDLRELIKLGLTKIPEDCVLAKCINLTVECYDKGIDYVTTRGKIVELSRENGLGMFNAPANVAFTVLGLLYGEGDFKKSMIYAVNCGDDTDCTGATLGSIFGIMYGTAGIPKDWAAYIGDDIVTISISRGSCYNLPKTCTALTDAVFREIPTMLHANKANVCLADADDFPEEDVKAYWDDKFSKKLLSIPGSSYDFDMIWADCRVVMPDGPDCKAGEPTKVQLVFTNKHNPEPKHLHIKWYLPEGWRVEGGSRNVNLGVPERYTSGTAIVEFNVIPGDNVDATNRAVVEVTTPRRPNAGLIPITLIG